MGEKYRPQKGDCVRVVLEGEVKDLLGDEGFAVGGGGIGFGNFIRSEEAHIVSVERVDPPKPPLPTTPGSVIENIDSQNRYVVLPDGGLLSLQTAKVHQRALRLLSGRSYEVIFDAGKAP